MVLLSVLLWPVTQTPTMQSPHQNPGLARLRSTSCPWTSNLMWPIKSFPSTLIRFSHTGVSKHKNLGIRILIWYNEAVSSLLCNNSIIAPLDLTDMMKGDQKAKTCYRLNDSICCLWLWLIVTSYHRLLMFFFSWINYFFSPRKVKQSSKETKVKTF